MKTLRVVVVLLALACFKGKANGTQIVFATGTMERISVTSASEQGNSDSFNPVISADGRHVAYDSYASNLVPGDTNNYSDVFVYDRLLKTTTRVSVSSDGTQGNSTSDSAFISGNGRFTVFRSTASNLVPEDTIYTYDIYLHDNQTGKTSLAAVTKEGKPGTGADYPTISDDGRYVAFSTSSANIVSGDTNRQSDVFVRDMQTGLTTRVSVSSSGTEANGASFEPMISANGRFVAFTSNAINLVNNDMNNQQDVFVHDLLTGQTSRVSISSGGTEGNQGSGRPKISADGHYIAFWSYTTNFITGDTTSWPISDIFVHDRQTSETKLVSANLNGLTANERSFVNAISLDGRYIVFYSSATDLVPNSLIGFINAFARDTQTNKTSLIGITPSGHAGNGFSFGGTMSEDNKYITFSSTSDNLVDGDTNSKEDVFVYTMNETYSISGHISNSNSSMDNVSIHLNGGGSVTTDSLGNYTFSVPAGTYTITPSKPGYTFVPASRTMTMPPAKSGLDFVGIPVRIGCGVPFLSQRDERWINYPLRSNGACSCNTIGTCGCTLISATMLFNYFGASLSPPGVSDCLGNSACPFSWTGAPGCSQGKAVWVGKYPFSWSRLDSEVHSSGRPVLLGMHKRNNSSATHWVVVVSGQGSAPEGYLINDPWFLGGTGMSLATRSRDYDFDWISIYSGSPSCTSIPATFQKQAAPGPRIPLTGISGSVQIYAATTTTMTVLSVAQSDAGNITQMKVWSSTEPAGWETFSTLKEVTIADGVYARFKDSEGNISDIVSDSIFPSGSPPREATLTPMPTATQTATQTPVAATETLIPSATATTTKTPVPGATATPAVTPTEESNGKVYLPLIRR